MIVIVSGYKHSRKISMEILIGGTRFPPLCGIIQGVLPQGIVFQISYILLSFDMLLLFCDFLTTLCSVGCRPMFMGMSPVLR